jgi:hypothetical protein
MRSPELAADYVRRAKARLAAVDALFAGESWADVVRESQEVVELALKGLLRAVGIEPPRIHDVSEVLENDFPRRSSGISTRWRLGRERSVATVNSPSTGRKISLPQAFTRRKTQSRPERLPAKRSPPSCRI